MKISNYKNKELDKILKNNIKLYLRKVLTEKQNSTGLKINIILSYLFPGNMLKIKQRLILKGGIAHNEKNSNCDISSST